LNSRGRGRGQADADVDTQIFSLPLETMTPDLLFELFRYLKSTLFIGLNEHHGQFVTTIAGCEIRGSDIASEKLAHRLDHIVSTEMSIGVVEVLEIINVPQ